MSYCVESGVILVVEGNRVKRYECDGLLDEKILDLGENELIGVKVVNKEIYVLDSQRHLIKLTKDFEVNTSYDLLHFN